MVTLSKNIKKIDATGIDIKDIGNGVMIDYFLNIKEKWTGYPNQDFLLESDYLKHLKYFYYIYKNNKRGPAYPKCFEISAIRVIYTNKNSKMHKLIDEVSKKIDDIIIAYDNKQINRVIAMNFKGLLVIAK